MGISFRADVAQYASPCYTSTMKGYIHARLGKEERVLLEELKRFTGFSESELVRRGLRLIQREVRPKKSALQLAGRSAGKFRHGPADLAMNKIHLDDFGE